MLLVSFPLTRALCCHCWWHPVSPAELWAWKGSSSLCLQTVPAGGREGNSHLSTRMEWIGRTNVHLPITWRWCCGTMSSRASCSFRSCLVMARKHWEGVGALASHFDKDKKVSKQERKWDSEARSSKEEMRKRKPEGERKTGMRGGANNRKQSTFPNPWQMSGH